MNNYVLTYDGSFEGLLCCIFATYEQRMNILDIQPLDRLEAKLFAETQNIVTEGKKANRVWNSLKKKTSSSGLLRLKWAFLSEEPGIEMHILETAKYIFSTLDKVDSDYSHPSVLYLSKMFKKVGREKHRMEAFIRFRLTKDDIYFAVIEPDFNVLPIIQTHFKNRYADQDWLIFDLKRKFGCYYDRNSVQFISMQLPENVGISGANPDFFKEEEIEFQQLWHAYFNHVNIKSRVNTRLHLQHVPKRYWKYLTEKSSFA